MTGQYNIPNSEDAIINSTIPANLTEVFSSATSDDGSTLSSAFDVQFRTWDVIRDVDYKQVDAGRPYSGGSYRTLESLILNNKTQAVEGLVVDTVRGGIGLRNHTIPIGLPYGGRWTEDLLWIGPVTTCVDTNLTFHFTHGDRDYNFTRIALVDNGGFSDLPREYPYPGVWNDTQNPDLQARAYKGAWISNALSAVFLNVTYPGNEGPQNTSKGREFSLGVDSFRAYKPALNRIELSPIDGGYLDLALGPNNFTGMNLSTTTQAKLGITSENFTYNQLICPGYGGGDDPNGTHMMIACGYFYGAPQRQDGVESLIFEPYKDWTQHLYVCATGIQASIKTVGFSINGSSSLSNVQIVSLDDKHYPDNGSKPLWAVEQTNLNISQINPFWGLVDDRYETAEGLATLRAEKFWLPAIYSSATILSSIDSIASNSAFGSALNDLYLHAATGSAYSQLADYSGLYNMALSRLWGNLSTSPTTASRIINLIYTDIISTAVVGTKSAIRHSSARAGPRTPNTLVQVTEYTRQIQYNWLYAIPAAVTVAATVLALLFVLVMTIISRFSISYMRQLLNQTSTGRIVTNILYPELSHPTAPTSKWIDEAGFQRLAFPMVPKGEAVGTMNEIETESPHPSVAPLTFGQAGPGKFH
ncbi:MAG: hypothetical protein Q9181_005751 [Wetmoreana brouardii]